MSCLPFVVSTHLKIWKPPFPQKPLLQAPGNFYKGCFTPWCTLLPSQSLQEPAGPLELLLKPSKLPPLTLLFPLHMRSFTISTISACWHFERPLHCAYFGEIGEITYQFNLCLTDVWSPFLNFVLILAFLVMSLWMGEKSSSQASSGHLVELQKPCIQMCETVVGPRRIRQSPKYVLHLIFHLIV